MLLSSVYLHYALGLWFEACGEAPLAGRGLLDARYIDDFVVCFQFRGDALRRLKKLCANGSASSALRIGTDQDQTGQTLAGSRSGTTRAGTAGSARKQFIFWGLRCTAHAALKGNFKVGMRTEKSRLRRSLMSLCDQMRQIRHLPIQGTGRRAQSLRHSAGALRLLWRRRKHPRARCRGCTG